MIPTALTVLAALSTVRLITALVEVKRQWRWGVRWP